MKKGAFWPNFTLFGHFIIFVIRMSIYKFLKLGKFTEHTISFAKKMKLLYVICLMLSCDLRKGHFLPKFGKQNTVLLKSVHEGIITNSRNSVRLLTRTSYLKK